jgi:hypothetical protein
MELGISIDDNSLQYPNALSPIDVTELGKAIEDKREHL